MCEFGHIAPLHFFVLLWIYTTDHHHTSLKSLSYRFSHKIFVTKPVRTTMDDTTWNNDRVYHNSMFSTDKAGGNTNSVHTEEIKTTPLFSADVLAKVSQQKSGPPPQQVVLPQYGLLAKVLETFGGDDESQSTDTGALASLDLVDTSTDSVDHGLSNSSKGPTDGRLFVNMNAPWSAFICGSQGSGKSHTLSCMLENALMPSRLSKLSHPLCGMVFHYDKLRNISTPQLCEAAYLASPDIAVKVFVSPSSFERMTRAYQNVPGSVEVVPLLLEERQLNVEIMMTLMAADEKDGRTALYMEVSKCPDFIHILFTA